MADHNPDKETRTDDSDAEYGNVSPGTVAHAYRAVRALEADGIAVEGVQFDYESDTFRVQLTDGFAGTDDGGDFTPQGIGGGTIKS